MLCRKKTPGMIHRPDIVASVMLYLCSSHILGDFKEMARMKQKKRVKLAKEWDKRYSMGMLLRERVLMRVYLWEIWTVMSRFGVQNPS